VGNSYKSMFSDNNWLLEPPFLTVNVLRKLTGILELPGMMGDFVVRSLTDVQNVWYLKLGAEAKYHMPVSRIYRDLIVRQLPGSGEAK